MGQFSWLYSDTNRAMLDSYEHDSFLIIPTEFVKEFGGHYIYESCYEGYGIMGGYDVYDLVAYWNKDFIKNNPDYTPRTHKCRFDNEKWYETFCEACSYNTFKEFKKFFEQFGIELRDVGIDIACYNEDNERLENPIKIVENSNLTYQQAYPSKSDPNQGWGSWADTVYPEDITGTIGEWLDMNTDELSYDLVQALQMAYDIACREL